MAGPNVLLLDEPTNDLDTDTLAAVEDLLDGWAGSLIVVSHDRYLLERVCERTVGLLGDGRLRDLPGGVQEYLRRHQDQAETPATATVSTQLSTQQPQRSEAKQSRDHAKHLARLERQLDKLTDQENALHAQLAVAATDYTQAAALDAQLRTLHEQREALETEWLKLAEQA